MDIVFWVLLGLLYSYIVFIAAPSMVFFNVLFMHTKQSRLLLLDEKNPYFPPYAARLKKADAFLRSLPSRLVLLHTRDNTVLRAVIYDAASDKTVVFLHGFNAPPLNNFATQAAFLYREGFNVVFLYQRAHGGSGGLTTMGCKESEDLVDVLPDLCKATNAKEVLLYGISMGCAAVSYASDKLDPAIVKAMVLDCGYVSPYEEVTREMRRRHLPVLLLAPWMTFLTRTFLGVSIKTPVTDALSRTTIPALFLHGGADETVPVEKGRANFEACASPKEWYSVPDALHTACYPAGGEDAQHRLLTFIRQYFI